jgi:ferritin-like protein
MKSVETLNTSTEAQSASDLLETQKVFIERIFKTLRHPMDLQTLFDRVFPLESDLPAILTQLIELKKCLDSFRPLDPDQLANLQSAWDTEYTYESNRIVASQINMLPSQRGQIL